MLLKVTLQSYKKRSLLSTIIEKSALMFKSQPWHCFMVSLIFHGPAIDAKWFLILCDHAGVVTTGPFEFVGIRGMTLVWVLYFLAFGALETIRVDLMIDCNPTTGKVTAIYIEHTPKESQTPIDLHPAAPAMYFWFLATFTKNIQHRHLINEQQPKQEHSVSWQILIRSSAIPVPIGFISFGNRHTV